MTDDELLRTALAGNEAEWAALHEVCRDRAQAEALARVLEKHTNTDSDAAVAWGHVLSDLHPGLTVNLPPAPKP